MAKKILKNRIDCLSKSDQDLPRAWRNTQKTFKKIAEGSPDPRVIHKFRVGTRRIASFFKLHPEVLKDKPRLRRLRSHLKKMRRTLGPIRELDVHLALLKALSSKQAVPLWVQWQFQKERARALKKLPKQVDFWSIKALIAKLSAKDWALAPRNLVIRPLRWQKSVDRLLKEHDTFLQSGEIAYLHQFRISLKKLRYFLEQMPIRQHWLEKALPLLKKWQDALGYIHDLETLGEELKIFQKKAAKNSKKDLRFLQECALRLDQEKEAALRRWLAGWPRRRTWWISLRDRPHPK